MKCNQLQLNVIAITIAITMITMYLILVIFNTKTLKYIFSDIYSNNLIYILYFISWIYSQSYILINLLNNFM